MYTRKGRKLCAAKSNDAHFFPFFFFFRPISFSLEYILTSEGKVCTFLPVRAVPCLRELNESRVRFLSDLILYLCKVRLKSKS